MVYLNDLKDLKDLNKKELDYLESKSVFFKKENKAFNILYKYGENSIYTFYVYKNLYKYIVVYENIDNFNKNLKTLDDVLYYTDNIWDLYIIC